MSATIYLLTLCLPLGTVLLVFGMRYFAKVREANARLAHEAAWRRTAETSTAAQAETAAALSAVQAALTDIRTRLTAVETILRAVE